MTTATGPWRVIDDHGRQVMFADEEAAVRWSAAGHGLAWLLAPDGHRWMVEHHGAVTVFAAGGAR